MGFDAILALARSLALLGLAARQPGAGGGHRRPSSSCSRATAAPGARASSARSAPVYPLTRGGPAGAAAARRTRGRAAAQFPGLKEPVIAAPTFVLFDEGREIGRITGYPGDDAFWGLLGKMLADMARPIQRRAATAARLE